MIKVFVSTEWRLGRNDATKRNVTMLRISTWKCCFFCLLLQLKLTPFNPFHCWKLTIFIWLEIWFFQKFIEHSMGIHVRHSVNYSVENSIRKSHTRHQNKNNIHKQCMAVYCILNVKLTMKLNPFVDKNRTRKISGESF